MARFILLPTLFTTLLISLANAAIFGKGKKDEGKIFGIPKLKIKNPLKKEKTLWEKLCFPGHARIIILNNDSNARDFKEIEIPMHLLRVGMRVKTGYNSYSPVFMFSHAERSGTFQFIALNNLTISAGHYVYTAEQGLMPARNVRIGHHLLTKGGRENVTRVSQAQEKGLFNPHTLDGSLVVNGYLTSTYTDAIPEAVGNSLLAPFRMFFSVLGKDLSFGILENHATQVAADVITITFVNCLEIARTPLSAVRRTKFSII